MDNWWLKKILLTVSMQYAGKIIKTDLFVLGSLNGPAHGCHVTKSFVITCLSWWCGKWSFGKSKWKWSEFHWEVSELNHRMISLLALDLITGWLVSYTSNHILTSGMIYLLYQVKKWIFAIISFFFPCVLVRAKVMFIYLFF